MQGSFGRLWKWFVEFNRDALAGGVMRMNEEEYKAALNATFDSAKRLSDFIGMFVRLAFSTFGMIYFLRKTRELEGFHDFVFGLCFVFAAGLTIVLGARVLRLVMLYEARDVPKMPNNGWRWVFVLAAVFTTFVLYTGIASLVGDLASGDVSAN
jgi:hypothetical protein